MTDKTWIDDSTCKEIGLVEDFEEKLEKSEVTSASEEIREQLAEMFHDDLVIVKSDFSLENGGFTLKSVDLVDNVLKREFEN